MIKSFITCRIGSNDFNLFESIINQGIDSHLEAFTKSEFRIEASRLHLDMDKSEIPILTRRLRELGTEDADQWANDIEERV